MTSYLYTKKTLTGRGVFSKKAIKGDEEILQFGGELLTYQDFPAQYTKFEDHCVQIDENLYLGPSGEIDDLFNHSCEPNAGLKINGQIVILSAIKDIKKGEEITWDYSTTMDEDFWEMDCMCNTKKCRKKIRDFKHLPTDIQNYYIKSGVVPDFILKKVKKQ